MIDGIDFVEMKAEEYWSPTNKAEKANPQALAKNMIFSGDYIGARKVDGHHYRFIKDGDILRLQGRTKSVSGEYLNKIDWVPHIKEQLEQLPDGTVLVGELYFPNKEGSKNVTTIMGCLQPKAIARQEKEDKLHFYIFDILAYDGYSLLNLGLADRIKFFDKIKFEDNSMIHFATYYEGEQLWKYIGWALSNGYEGTVIQRKDGIYSPGKRTARKTLKIKKEIQLEIDAFLTGNIKIATREYKGKEPEHWNYWFNLRTNEYLEGEENYDTFIHNGLIIPVTKDWFYGLPSSIEFGVYNDNGEVVSLCWISNITDDIKWEIKESQSNCFGKVAKITGMEIDDETGSLRHSKIVEWREDGDKSYLDCKLSQL